METIATVGIFFGEPECIPGFHKMGFAARQGGGQPPLENIVVNTWYINEKRIIRYMYVNNALTNSVYITYDRLIYN